MHRYQGRLAIVCASKLTLGSSPVAVESMVCFVGGSESVSFSAIRILLDRRGEQGGVPPSNSRIVEGRRCLQSTAKSFNNYSTKHIKSQSFLKGEYKIVLAKIYHLCYC